MATNATYTVINSHSSGNMVNSIVRVSGINYTAGTPETIEAVGCEMKYITHIAGGASESKTYFALGQVSGSTGATTAGLMWFVSSSGAEVSSTDLSAEYVTLSVTGF
jgi:hypothetical protein